MPFNSSYNVALNPTMTSSASDPFSNSILSSSISSLSTRESRHTSPVTKTYRQASTLFLTRRLPEAISTILPIINPPNSADNAEPAPVASSSRTTRIKVWSLYLTILNAIVEMEPEEGKDAFGNQEWRALCAKVRDGAIWDEVIMNGYHGVEGDVDADVVINLATLLLAHARDQSLNQKRLETYLALSTSPNLDLTDKLNGSSPRRMRSPGKANGGANTPRDLNARVKILELYTLHVLLRNNEWDYAREFINMSPVLDEERREAFLQALQSLWDEQQEHDRLEQEERERQEEQLQNEIAEAKRQRAENEEREKKRLEEERLRRESSEVDYGIEKAPSVAGSTKSQPAKSSPSSTSASKQPQPRSSISRPKAKPVAAPLTLTGRASLIISRLGTLIQGLAFSLNSNPAIVMKLLAFIMSFVFMLGHKATRERVQQILGSSWVKLQATVGMGTKVSYI
ncbi:hypothetical protein PT974_08435 [Cladobotryum mycophilum]|uniref:Peroxin 26 n=1 Tax=Cladobotryum mycophilum TaxID=491253 RepID=A0ABR0SDY3_9HYPO